MAASIPPPAPGLPVGLAGPVTVALARPQETIPGARALAGGCVYELKWDGFRCVIVRDSQSTRLWSRQGTDLTNRFPEIAVAAAAQIPAGTVIDGEVVIWNGDRLDFDLLQRRLASGAARIRELVKTHQASFVAFDLLATAGTDLRPQLWRSRRAALERVARWEPPLQLSPTTEDVTVARTWMADYRPAGIEGLVVKGATTRYTPGKRNWIKVKSRATHEVIVGAVIGPMTRPETVVAGLYRGDELVIVGRTVPLTRAQSQSLAAVLEPAAAKHPWPDTIGSGRFGGSRAPAPLTKVAPTVVAEVSADTGVQAGVWRHPLRYLRHRPDLTPTDLPTLT